MQNERIIEYNSIRIRWPGERAAWWWARLWYGLGGIVLPVFCWSMSFSNIPPHLEWQSGRWRDWAGLFLQGQVSWPLFPLLGYSIVCPALLLVRREYFARFFLVRFGIYTALPQTMVFGIVMVVGATISLVTAVAVVVIAGMAVGLWWLTRRAGWIVPGILAGVAVLTVLAGLGLMLTAKVYVVDTLFLLMFGGLSGGPYAALLSYTLMSIWLWRQPQGTGASRVRIAASSGIWIGAQVAGWSLAVIRAMEVYARLPKTPPSHCYVATAAARGHRRFVGSTKHMIADEGTEMWINPQLRVLKCGEIALQTLWPRGHAACRRVYDTVGPWLARRLTHPLLADAAYLALKPAEWLTRAGLRVLGANRHITRIYSTR